MVKAKVQETSLAWALAEAVKPLLSDVERYEVFVALGAGETFAVIRELLRWVVAKGIRLSPDLVGQCTAWLDAYHGHDDERYLRHLIEKMLVPDVLQLRAGEWVNPPPITPTRGQVVRLTAPPNSAAQNTSPIPGAVSELRKLHALSESSRRRKPETRAPLWGQTRRDSL
jgi:hypothetical protein